jgi:amino acid adenylation domain-containing protein
MSKFSCFVVGKGAIALKCLEILQQAGHNTLGIYSADRSLQPWAAEHKITYSTSQGAFCGLLFDSQYDYLFSINNGWIIPPDIIACARRATINYHDALLPKYAGLYATSWALLHGETEHGITWHQVVPDIDAGLILKQAIVPIGLDDTAFSLNTRCFEVAVDAFAELIYDLANDRVKGVTQNRSQRSYFGLTDRPEAAGLLNFNAKTKSIQNLVRSLDFGPTRNPLGCAKLWLSHGVVGIGEARPLLNHAGMPGQVLAVHAEKETSLWVATIDGAVELNRITTLEGKLLSKDDLHKQYGVVVDCLLPKLNDFERQAISEQNARICRYERHWIEQLSQLAPFVHPYLREGHTSNGECRFALFLTSEQSNAEWLLACFALYCARLATDSTIDIGLQTAAQCSVAPEIFAQCVPIRIELKADEQLNQFCERFRVTISQAVHYGNYSLDIVARYPELKNAPSILPVAIVLAEDPTKLKFQSLKASMALVAYTDGSAPELIHDGALSQQHSQAILQQLQTFITASFDQPEQRVSEIPLLSANERQQILFEWNCTAQPYPHDRCIHDVFVEQARKTPDAISVRFGEDQLSYQDLDRRSNQLAHYLNQIGILNRLVALCLPRGVDLIVGLLGILKAGGAYVPIDPTYPIDRIAYLIGNSCPQVIITVEALQTTLFSQAKNVLCLDKDATKLAQMSSQSFATDITPNDLAYVIYTSGSTGKPKGVEIRHRSVVNHGWAIANIYELSLKDRVLQSASVSFDVAGEQIYPALFRGATVVIRPDDLMESFDRFLQFIQAQVITILILPTAFWHEWTIELSSSSQKVPASLRVIAVGTEKALSSRLEQWLSVSENRVTFFQGYGPTESTITCSLYCYDGQPLAETLPIGTPLPNTEIYILDRYAQPVPVGVVGELYVGGDGLARGYHQQPALTAERFIPHPFRQTGNLYRTGDMARFEPDGQIIYCDRSDDQIKLNGFRIELGEIEAAFNEHPQIKQAVVLPYERSADLRSLVAYVIPDSEQALSVEDLKQFARQKLPSYMIPSVIIFLDAIPLTQSGKVDRRALPAPEATRPKDLGVIELTQNPLERQLMFIWERVLEIQPIATTDNFFDFGGNSLTAVKLINQVEKAFGQRLSIAALFQAPTIKQFADVLREGRAVDPWAIIEITPLNGKKPPLFWCQNYGDMIPHLDPGQPFFALESGYQQVKHPETHISDLAAGHADRIRRIQPQGPYLIGGYCFGGYIALEIAQILRSQGQEVALLVLVETYGPKVPFYQRNQWLPYNLIIQFASIRRRILGRFEQRRHALENEKNAQATGGRVVKVVMPPKEPVQQAVQNYRPQPYFGKVVLFEVELSSLKSVLAPKAFWGKIFWGDFTIEPVKGTHQSVVLHQNGWELVERLQSVVDQAISGVA